MPAVSFRTWLGTGLFSAALVVLLLVLLVGMRWWQRRVRAAADETGTVLRNTSLPFVLQLVNRGIDLGFAMVLYRFIDSLAIQGTFDAAALIVVTYLGTIADWGLTVLLTRDVARDRSTARATFERTFNLRMRLALLAIPAAGLVIGAYALLKALGLTASALDQGTITLMGILVLTLLPSALSGAVTALLQAYERMEVAALVNVFTNIASALLRTAGLALGFGLVGVAGGALLGATFGAVMFWVVLRRFAPEIRLGWQRKADWRMLREGWPLLLNSLLIGVFFRFDTLIIQAFQGAAAVATYAAGYKFIALTQIIPPVVVNAVFPMLARRADNDRAGMQRAYAGTLRLLLIVAFPLAMGMMLLATPLIVGLAEAKYLPGAAVALSITIWYLPGSYINGLTQYVAIALNRQHAITRAFWITAIFNFGLNVLLVPHYSYIAAAWITIASELVLFLPLQRTLRREGIQIKLLPLLVRPALAALAMGGVMWLALGVHWLVAALAGPLVYGVVFWLLGGVTEDDRAILRRLRRRGAVAA